MKIRLGLNSTALVQRGHPIVLSGSEADVLVDAILEEIGPEAIIRRVEELTGTKSTDGKLKRLLMEEMARNELLVAETNQLRGNRR